MTHDTRPPHRDDDPGIPTLTVRHTEHTRTSEPPPWHTDTPEAAGLPPLLTEEAPDEFPPASGQPAAHAEPVLRAALQAAVEDAVDEALDEAVALLRARLQARLPDIVAQVLRQTRSG